jgi:hypothetical protein
MVVDAEIWYWTPTGMRRARFRTGAGYIAVAEVERLLEEADVRRLNQERARRDDEIERRRDTGEP